MSLKIIQETNYKKIVLTLIPCTFEQNSVYWFPSSNWSTKKLNNLIKNPYAKPNETSWEAWLCIVKKSNTKTFAEAKEAKDALLDKSITKADADASDADDD